MAQPKRQPKAQRKAQALFLSPTELADALGRDPATVYRLMAEGFVPYTFLGTRRVVAKSWLDSLEADALTGRQLPA